MFERLMGFNVRNLGSGGETHGGSSPSFRTNNFQSFKRILVSRCAQFCAQSPFLGRLGSGFRAAQREESSLNRISLGVNVTLRNRELCPAIRANVNASQPDSARRLTATCRRT